MSFRSDPNFSAHSRQGSIRFVACATQQLCLCRPCYAPRPTSAISSENICVLRDFRKHLLRRRSCRMHLLLTTTRYFTPVSAATNSSHKKVSASSVNSTKFYVQAHKLASGPLPTHGSVLQLPSTLGNQFGYMNTNHQFQQGNYSLQHRYLRGTPGPAHMKTVT
jgi:hypothetical protein